VALAGIVVAKKFPWAAWPCVAAVPLGWAVYGLMPEEVWLINLPTAFFALGAVLFLFLFNNGAGPRKVEGAC
jgi:hypothetical protein